jgi:hypothetical protein
MCAFWRKARAARKVAKRVHKRKKKKKKKAKRQLRAERRKEKKLKKAEKKKAKKEKKEKAKDAPTATDATAAGDKAVEATMAVAAAATVASTVHTPPPAEKPLVKSPPVSAPVIIGSVSISPEAEQALAKLTQILTDPEVDLDHLAYRIRANNGGRRSPEVVVPQDWYFLSKAEIVRSAAITSAQMALFLKDISDEGMAPDQTKRRTGPY